jgi:formate dehydrogenase subunit gamma
MNSLKGAFVALLLCMGLVTALSFDARAASSDGDIPTVAQPRPVITDMWREARQGMPGVVVSQPEARGVLIQSEGELWRDLRNGIVAYWGALAMGGVAAAIAVFYLLRGPIRMEGGPSGRTILRFKTVERVGHWMTAGSFLVLAFTGLNILFGRWAIEPWLGKEVFAAVAMAGKWLHNIGGLFFMVGLLMIFVMWSKENLWDRYDLNWILQGGGLLFKGKHPPAAKFNFGQKTQYWMVILVGAAVSYTGVNLLFPFMFFGMQGMQLLHIAHVALAIVMILFMLGHIYIGTIGMEGASDAMTSGFVDEKWAEEHHAAWVAEERAKAGKSGGMQGHPAE